MHVRPVIVHIITVSTSLVFLADQLNRLAQNGYEVHVVTGPGEELHTHLKEDIRRHNVDMQRSISPLKDLFLVITLVRLLVALRPQLIHSHTPKAGLLGTVAGVLAGVPVRVYHVHGLPLMTAAGMRKIVYWLSEKASCLLASRVICVSNSLKQSLLDFKLCSPQKATVLLNGSISGVDAKSRFNPANVSGEERNRVRNAWGVPLDATLVGYFGRVAASKGLEDLTEAWKHIRPKHASVALAIVGPNDDADPLPEEWHRTVESDARIFRGGAVQAEYVPTILAVFDIVVMPSYREGFGLVAIEAAAMVKPVIATSVTGCVDAVEDGITGILVPPWSGRDLARAIEFYLERIDLRRMHGENGRKRVLESFDPTAIFECLIKEYETLHGGQTAKR